MESLSAILKKKTPSQTLQYKSKYRRVAIVSASNSRYDIMKESCAKILVRRILSDRYRITQEKFQYHRV